MRMNPAMMNSVAGNFQLRIVTFLRTWSTTAFKGIPSNVPMDMNRGKVYAIPKLMLRLNTTLRAELAQR